MDPTFEAGLVHAVRCGERDAYDRLVRAHLAGAYGLAHRLVGSADDAEDVVQEAFLKAHEALDSFTGKAAFGTWLYRIVVNASLDHLRKRKRQRLVRLLKEDDLALRDSRSQGVDHRLRGHELATALDRAIDELPFRMKTAMILRVVEGQSYEQVAQVLGTTATTSRVYVSQARKRLFSHLEPLL